MADKDTPSLGPVPAGCVRIVSAKNAKGWRIINQADFKPDEHEVFGAPKADKGSNPRAGGAVETEESRRAVDIPKTWRELPFNDRKAIAARVSPMPVRTKEEVDGAIEAEIKIRDDIAAQANA